MGEKTVDREQTRRDAEDYITAPRGVWTTTKRIIGALLAELEQAEQREATANTDLHSLRWLLGLDTHDGEQPQSRSECHRNLNVLLDQR